MTRSTDIGDTYQAYIQKIRDLSLLHLTSCIFGAYKNSSQVYF